MPLERKPSGTADFIVKATKRLTKKAETAERDIEKAFSTYAEKAGCKAIKLILLNKRGFPDRTILCPGGKVLFIEFKRKGKKQSPTQKIVQKTLESYGFKYYVCDQIGQAESHLDKFLKLLAQ